MFIELFLIITLSIGIVLFILTLLLHLIIVKIFKRNSLLLVRLILVLLILQFLLGMAANLFQTIPYIKPWLVFHDFGYILFHTINATLLIILSIMYLIQVRKEKTQRFHGIIGLTGIVIAYIGGVIFVDFGQNNIFSFIMAVGFIVSTFVYSYQSFNN